MKAAEEQRERAVAALLPYVHEWDLSLDPEDLFEHAGAVLEHVGSDESFDAAERARIADYERRQVQL